MTDPGRFRELITVQKEEQSEGAHHSPTRSTSWVKAFDARAKVSLDGGKTETLGGKENPRQRGTFHVPARDGYNADRRIVWGGDVYEITAVRPADPMRQELKVEAVFSGHTA